MALTQPTPPTPPTPPVVPRVVLGGGGSVTESTQPVNGTSNDETQARAAVARGDGALEKTTTEQPQGNQTTQSGAQPPAQTPQQAAQADGAPEAAAGAQGAQGAQEDAAALPAAQQQALAEGRQMPAAGGHGALYLGFSVVSFLVLAAAVFFWLRRRAAQGGLRFQEMAQDLRGAAAPSEERPELRGLTAGEVLEDIEAEEQRELAAARARAKAWRAQRERERAAASAAQERRGTDDGLMLTGGSTAASPRQTRADAVPGTAGPQVKRPPLSQRPPAVTPAATPAARPAAREREAQEEQHFEVRI
ncbi:MAG: hypothetical protein KA985_00670 [Selenomonas sp.]|nr:hypothetical protein [Selenomonas sp.]